MRQDRHRAVGRHAWWSHLRVHGRHHPHWGRHAVGHDPGGRRRPGVAAAIPPEPLDVVLVVHVEEELELLIKVRHEWVWRVAVLAVPPAPLSMPPAILAAAATAATSWPRGGSLRRRHRTVGCGRALAGAEARRSSRQRLHLRRRPATAAAGPAWRRPLGEAARVVYVPVYDAAEPAANIVGELLPVARKLHRSVTVQWIPQALYLMIGQVVEAQPLHIEEAPKAIEGVYAARARLADRAAHARIALEGIAAVHGEDEDHRRGRAVGLVQPLLVLPLRGPEAMAHGLHDVLLRVARDHEVAGVLGVHAGRRGLHWRASLSAPAVAAPVDRRRCRRQLGFARAGQLVVPRRRHAAGARAPQGSTGNMLHA
mmetsp:Transcript_94656/g.282704  ORF Transcript_94656/g.282704 Transcript_94656/m.282704 type:complete len:369 (+) Transcript_94656:398-1504(+)